MTGRKSRQVAMIFADIESMIPENHLLREVDRIVPFDFIYDYLAPYYSGTDRPYLISILPTIVWGKLLPN